MLEYVIKFIIITLIILIGINLLNAVFGYDEIRCLLWALVNYFILKGVFDLLKIVQDEV